MTNRIVDFPDSYTSGTTPTITDPNLTAHLNDTTDAHDASAISNVPSGNLAATDVQAALNELQGDIDSLSGNAVEVAQDALAASFAAGTQDGVSVTYNDGLNKFDIANTDKGSTAVSGHESDVTAHPASSIVNTPSGNLAATEVQAALNELQSDIDTRATSASLSAHTGASSGVHGVTGSVVGTSDAQVLTNKDIDGGTASNTRRITIPKDTYANLLALTRKEGTIVYATDTDKVYYDDGSTLRPVGSGSGGGINFLPLSATWSLDNTDNVDAEISVGQWVAFADAASATPTDLTGGSPNITIARTTTAGEVLNGNASFEITKTTANRQGEGVSCLFNVPPAYQGKLCQIKIPYKVVGTITTGDVTAWIYDVTNSLLITPLANNIDQASGTLNAFFTTSPSAGTPANQQYRIGIYFGSTSTNAQSIYFDDVSVGPVDSVYGPNIDSWKSYTPTYGAGLGVVTNNAAFWRQVGDSIEAFGYGVTGTVSAAVGSVSLPNNFALDSSKLSPTNTTAQSGPKVGDFITNSVGSSALGPMVTATGTSTTLFYFGGNTGFANALIPSTSVSTTSLPSNKEFSWRVTLPISSLQASTPATIINPNIGPWQTFTPTLTGFGSVSNVVGRYRQVGETIELETNWTNGSPTGGVTITTITLPPGLVTPSDYPALAAVGFGNTSASLAASYQLLAAPSESVLYFGVQQGAAGGLNKAVGNNFSGSANMSFKGFIRIQGLSAAGVINNPRRRTRFSGGNGYGSTNTKIRRFTTIIEDTFPNDWYTVTNDATNGCFITITRDGNFSAGFKDRGTALTGLSLNSTQLTTNIQSINDADILDLFEHSGADGKAVWSGHLKAGDKVYYHTNGGSIATAATDVRAWFSCIGG